MSNSQDTLRLAIELIKRPSVTPNDEGCQELIIDQLNELGFETTALKFGDTYNSWVHRGESGPLLVFAGHTDVVPTGPKESWSYPPFSATLEDGMLWGRGAADMKGSLAAMTIAIKRFVKENPNHKGSIALLLTSDEEGPSTDGTVKVIEYLNRLDEKIDWCIVGEPSSQSKLGDQVKNGRRGSLNATLTIQGKQGHIAYPELAINPIHQCFPALNALVDEVWDHGSEFFPPTSLQFSNINAGTGATNVIPGTVKVLLNFRYSTAVTAEQLKARTEKILNQFELNYLIDWNLSGEPFLTEKGDLLEASKKAIKKVTGIDTVLSTGGGTSDGRFIAPTGAQVIELGPLNKTIHQVNECVCVQDLENLSEIYQRIMENLLTEN